MAHAESPRENGEGGAGHAHQRHRKSEVMEISAGQQARAGIKRRESEGHHPAEKEFDVARINGKWIAAEHQQIPERRVDAHAVFKPE